VVIALALFTFTGWAVWFFHDLVRGLPDSAAIRGLGDMAQATTIYDANDQPVFTIYKEQRIEVPLERVSPNVIKAVISVEDQRFYDHSGVDFVRVGAAVLRDLQTGRRAEGGSTITQQLARQSFLSRDKTFRRKLKEVILAATIEREYSKHDILQLYLNKVYFGDGYYGIEAAARGYFGKHASDLTVDEAALLAGLIQSPSSYAPTGNLERAIARRNVVLQAMLSNGAIDSGTYDRARRAQVTLVNSLEMKERYGLYFKEQVRKELVDRFGWPRVAAGGLKVYTTIDPQLQQAAEKVVETGLETIEKRKGYPHPKRNVDGDTEGDDSDTPDYLQGALVAMDPSTGAVRAMVGGRDFNESRFNRATQAKRQAGSAFKPFVYAAAIEAGYSPASIVSNLNDPILTAEGKWVPEDEHSSATSMTVRTALRTSSNRAAVQMLNTIGIDKAVAYAQRMNIGTPPSVPSIALGASDVTLLSMTAAYGAFADEGIVHTPVFIRRVETREGKVLYQDPGKSQRAISEDTAFLMTSMLADVINAGTASKARSVGFTLPAAGKTGTTNDYNDAWFIGFTPHLVAGVWVGFDQPQTIVRNGYAADIAVPIWASFMKLATKGNKPDWFTKPANVVAVNVCRMSGKLPNAGCGNVQTMDSTGAIETRSMIYTDYFVKGTEPTTLCPLHPGGTIIDALTTPTPTAAGPSATSRPSSPSTATATSGAAPPPAPAASGGTTAQPQKPEQQPKPEDKQKKKRGFWGRLFGRGGGL
jgi:1A family penicillin-binding protein